MTLTTVFTGTISGNNVGIYNGNVLGSTMSIKGEVVKVLFYRGDAAAAGSVFLYESGVTPELIFQKIGALQTNSVHYPTVYPVDNTNAAISGAGGTVVRRIVNAPLFVVGSGWGNAGSTISGLYIYLNQQR